MIKSKTTKNLFYSLLTFSIKTFNQLIIFVILAKILDLSSFGKIGYFITIAIITSNVVDFGYRLLLVKDFAIKKVQENLDNINYIIFVKLFVMISEFLIFLIYSYFIDNNSLLA